MNMANFSDMYTNIPILRDDEIAKEVEKWRLEINTLNKLFSGLILKAKLQAELVKLARGTVYFVYGKGGSGISSINASIESPLQVSWTTTVHNQRTIVVGYETKCNVIFTDHDVQSNLVQLWNWVKDWVAKSSTEDSPQTGESQRIL
ncbi:hypothetical protein ACKLNR_011278 [Fusarium oxysporum f. sp. zingiberi]